MTDDKRPPRRPPGDPSPARSNFEFVPDPRLKLKDNSDDDKRPTFRQAPPEWPKYMGTRWFPSGLGQPGWDCMSEFGGANMHERHVFQAKDGTMIVGEPTGKTWGP